jgi:hypothetical protein
VQYATKYLFGETLIMVSHDEISARFRKVIRPLVRSAAGLVGCCQPDQFVASGGK